jgi:hypothetical protein
VLYLLILKKKERKEGREKEKGRKEKKKGKKEGERERGEKARGLFPRAGMPYWLCHSGISLAVRCNWKLF